MRPGRRRVGQLGRALGLAAAVAVGAPLSSASAHDGDTVTTPADGATVACGALDQAEIRFGEDAVDPIVEIAGPDGARLELESAFPTATDATLSFAALTDPGTYDIRWFAQGRDNHPINGSAGFEVADDCDDDAGRGALTVVVIGGTLALLAVAAAVVSRRRARQAG